MTKCTVRETNRSGIRVALLENELLKVSVLIGKGADLYEMVYKPMDMDVLLKTPGGLEAFRGRDLSARRLKMYAELYPGGWQDCLPHRARYGPVTVEQETGGIAATLPWDGRIELADGGDAASVHCFVWLPEVPLQVEKTFAIRSREAVLRVTERIRNVGNPPVAFTWTQHPAFGGAFLEGRVDLEVPDCRVFHPRLYRAAPERGLASFEEPIDRIALQGGALRDIRRMPPRESKEELFVVLTGISEPWARIVNRSKGIGIRLSWQLDAFPYIRCWVRSDTDMYTMAVEPSNDAFASLADSLAHGTYRELASGEAYDTAFACELYEPGAGTPGPDHSERRGAW
jgi:hypothetical protein